MDVNTIPFPPFRKRLPSLFLLTFPPLFVYDVLMSTSSKYISGRRIARLAATERRLFHTDDLAVLLGIQNPNTLRVTLSRLVRAGILHRVQRGLLSMLPLGKIDPAELGEACLHRFCTLTTESVLHDEGYILQSVDAVTFVSDVSRRFEILGHRFVSRRLHARFLQNLQGIGRGMGVLRATPERAIADMLYFDPWYHFDRPVPWARVRALQEEIGYPLTPHRYADSART